MDEAAGAHDAGQEGPRRAAGGAGVEVVAGLAGAGTHAATNDGGREHAGGKAWPQRCGEWRGRARSARTAPSSSGATAGRKRGGGARSRRAQVEVAADDCGGATGPT